ncbi:BofC C-terminal domain-containing protein [Brevibacillus daliensis]|uniref:BofC C-terminal domain-containing protein n=1 Tax=Brevibacillus daliensis TaxID=2892995 RepID=UPI001E3FD77C|nr:BofC C-terminal domain-containing protein [Brevibacillus daliensis]
MFKQFRFRTINRKLFLFVLMIGIGVFLGVWLSQLGGAFQASLEASKEQRTISEKESVPVFSSPRQLVLTRTYICGVENEERVETNVTSMEQLLKPYQGWRLVSINQDEIVLHKDEEDLAPICKQKGYFGLSPDGFLTLFEGLPDDQKAIQTFYRINTDRLEANLTKAELDQLYKGIRIYDLADYNSILSSLSEFQRDQLVN